MPYQKDFERSRTLTLLKLNCPFIWLTILWAKIYESYESYLFYSCNMILSLYLWVYFFIFCVMCVCVCFFFFSFFTRWPACWAYACSGSLPLDLYMFNYCIIFLFMLWRIKFSLFLLLLANRQEWSTSRKSVNAQTFCRQISSPWVHFVTPCLLPLSDFHPCRPLNYQSFGPQRSACRQALQPLCSNNRKTATCPVSLTTTAATVV